MNLIEKWNTTEKPKECIVMAMDGDILEIIDGVFFLCQRRNDCNNIICFNLETTNCIRHIKAMFKFCIHLWENYDIRYIRVEGNIKRYNFLTKIFTIDEVVKDLSITHRNVYYCDLKHGNSKLKELIND